MMIPKDIKEMSTDELKMEYSFLREIVTFNTTITDSDWKKLDDRMHYIAYELSLRKFLDISYPCVTSIGKHQLRMMLLKSAEQDTFKISSKDLSNLFNEL